MQAVDWAAFLNLAPFMLLGLAYHVISKITKAQRRKDFTWHVFRKQNLLGYVGALILCVTGLMFLASGIDLMPGVAQVLVSFTIGITGGSMIRDLPNRLRYLKRKR